MGLGDRDYMRGRPMARRNDRPVKAPPYLKLKFFFWRLFRFLKGKR
jgi:hypothetical protein